MRPFIWVIQVWMGWRVSDHRTALAPGSMVPMTWRLMVEISYNGHTWPRIRWSVLKSFFTTPISSALPYFSGVRPDSTRCHSWAPPVRSPPPVQISSRPHLPARTKTGRARCSWCGKRGASAGGKVLLHLIGSFMESCEQGTRWVSILIEEKYKLSTFPSVLHCYYGCYDLGWGSKEGSPWNWAVQIFVWTLTVYLIRNSEDSSYLDTPARPGTTALQKQMVVCLTGTSSSFLLGHSSKTLSLFTPQSFYCYTNVILHKMHLFGWLLVTNAIIFNSTVVSKNKEKTNSQKPMYIRPTCLTGNREPTVCKELNFSQLVISSGSRKNWRPL